MKKIIQFSLISGWVLSAHIAHAAVGIAVTAMIDSVDSTAFSVGETVTVTFTIADGIGAPNLENTATSAYWQTDGTFWSSITVSGATGTYNSATSDPTKWLESGDRRDSFYAAAYDDVDNGFGLLRNGEEINFVDAFISPSALVAAVYGADSSVTPENTFINGLYDVSSATGLANNSLYLYTDAYTNEYIGTISTIEISGATVPEPSAYSMLVGLIVLCGVVSRRR